MATFRNPNDPQQPQRGVYGWFVTLADGGRCLYVGEAGKRSSPKEKGTLLRGVTELFRETFSTDSPGYQSLDTDFVVGTAIRFFESKAGPVFCEHLANDPGEEDRWVREYKPLIQKAGVPEILPQLKVKMDEIHYWRWSPSDHKRCRRKVAEAEQRVHAELDKLLSNKPLQADGAPRRR